MISKELFCEVIDSMKCADTFQKDLNKVYKNNGADGYYWWDDCSTAVLKLLQDIFKNNDYVDFIEDFCYTYDFGKSVKNDSFKDADGQYIKLSTAEELYDYLTKQEAIACLNLD